MNKKAVVKSNGTDLAVPDYLQVEGETGTENITANEIKVPDIRITQGLSSAKEIIEDLKDGDFYNTVTDENYGKEIVFHALRFWYSRIWFTKEPNEFKGEFYRELETGTIIKKGPDVAYCDENPNEYKDCYNFFIVTQNQIDEALANGTVPFPIHIGMISSAISCAKQINGKTKTEGMSGRPIFASKVRLVTFLKPFAKTNTKAWVPRANFLGYATEPEFNLLKELFAVSKTLQGKIASVNDKDGEEPFDNQF